MVKARAGAARGTSRPVVVDPALPTERERQAVGYYASLAVVAGWLSCGPDAGLYALAYRTIPAWSLLRAPARFGILVGLALAALAAIGLAGLLRRTRRPALVAAAVGALAVAELSAMPWDVRDALPVAQPYRVLAQLPPGAVAEFPFFFRPIDFHRNTLYMLYSTAHWHPLVNGYSDYMPDDFRQMVIPVSSFPAWEALGILRAHGARYVVFHMNLYDVRSHEKLLEQIERYREYIRPLAQEGDTWLYEIVKGTEG
jgi:4-amino-4-deoxy-L-arabinose transferase-like glycosyltransferase